MSFDVPAYTYKCVDRSVLVGPFCRYFVRWFVIWMPPAVPANMLTIGSSLCMWGMLLMGLFAPLSPVLALWCLALMAGYVIYDHADGMHSRRTGTSSPLGEYLDHYTDVFHGAIAIAVMFVVAGRVQSPLMVMVLWAVLLAGAATMAEERERRELFFGVTGPLEAMLLTLFFFGSWCFDSAAVRWHTPLVGGLTFFETAMAAGAVGSVMTAVACVRRIGRIPLGLVAYGVMSAILVWSGLYFQAPWWVTALLLSLHAGDYTGRVIAGHLRGTPRPWPDVAVPVVMILSGFMGLASVWIVLGAAAYLLIRNVVSTIGVFSVFGRHWRWLNPPSVSLTAPTE
jgi:ethanolaminephosphotransferase